MTFICHLSAIMSVSLVDHFSDIVELCDNSWQKWTSNSVNVTAIPYLCDSVLLEIFAHLELNDLYVITQCSRRFRALALLAFNGDCALSSITHWIHSYMSSRSDEVDILRVFGSITRNIKSGINLDADVRPLPWHLFDVSILHSLEVDETQIRSLCQQNTCFNSVKHLNITRTDMIGGVTTIDFRQCFPKLKSLILGDITILSADKTLMPRDLQSLEVSQSWGNAGRFRALLRHNSNLCSFTADKPPDAMTLNDLIEFMVECGLHQSLQTLKLYHVVPNDSDISLTDNLLLFEKLESIDIDTNAVICISRTSSFFQQMHNLKKLKIFHVPGMTANDFCDAFAANAPIHLEALTYRSMEAVDQTAWREFVKKMPSPCQCEYIRNEQETDPFMYWAITDMLTNRVHRIVLLAFFHSTISHALNYSGIIDFDTIDLAWGVVVLPLIEIVFLVYYFILFIYHWSHVP